MKSFFLFMKINQKKLLIVLLIVTVILRMGYALVVYSKTGMKNWDDDFHYLHVGEQIARGNWSPEYGHFQGIVVGPVLPLLVAGCNILFKSAAIPMIVYNVIVTTLMVLVLFLLAREIFGITTAWILAGWSVFFVEVFKYLPRILKEPTLFLLMPLTILFLIKTVKGRKPLLHLIGASLSFSMLIHTDERFFIYFPFFILLFLFAKPFRTVAAVKQTSIWILMIILLMVPWTVRNYKVYDQVVILTPRTSAFTAKLWGKVLVESAAHFFDEDIQRKRQESGLKKAVDAGETHEIEPEEYLGYNARLKALMHFWQPVFLKPTHIQYGNIVQKWSLKHNAASMAFYGVFLPFYALGIALMVKRKMITGIVIAVIPILHGFLHAFMVWPKERYRSPVTFIVVMIGIWAALETGSYIRAKLCGHGKAKIE